MINTEEIWKKIPGYEGVYEVSSLGRVKSFFLYDEGVIFKGSIDSHGYPSAVLYKDNIGKTFRVHVLMGLSFWGYVYSREGGLVIDHINNIKTDNRLENLQIISHRRNTIKDRKRKGVFEGARKHSCYDKYISCIIVKSRKYSLGVYDLEYQASMAYNIASYASDMGLNVEDLFPIPVRTSKMKGVCWHKRVNRWVAQINVDKKKIHLGAYSSEDEAAKVYCMALNRKNEGASFLSVKEEFCLSKQFNK